MPAVSPTPKIPSEDGRLYLSLMVESGERLQRMIEGLLEYSRLDSVTTPYSIDTGTIVDQCLLRHESRVKAVNATIEYHDLPTIWGDRDQIAQLFNQLIDNALKFAHKQIPPRISIAALDIDGSWQFTVTDNGIGISPKFHETIFKIFQCLHPNAEYPGIGMGSAIARKIVLNHVGAIWARSCATGSCVCFTIPKTPQ